MQWQKAVLFLMIFDATSSEKAVQKRGKTGVIVKVQDGTAFSKRVRNKRVRKTVATRKREQDCKVEYLRKYHVHLREEKRQVTDKNCVLLAQVAEALKGTDFASLSLDDLQQLLVSRFEKGESAPIDELSTTATESPFEANDISAEGDDDIVEEELGDGSSDSDSEELMKEYFIHGKVDPFLPRSHSQSADGEIDEDVRACLNAAETLLSQAWA